MLLDSLRSSNVFSEDDNSKTFNTPTGFTIFDALGCNIEETNDGIPYLNGGVAAKFYEDTGMSGVGKSMFMIQKMCSAVDYWNSRYPDKEPSDFILIDAEDNTEINRVQQLSHWDFEYLQKHFQLRKDVDLKEIYNYILKIVDLKSKNPDAFMCETNMRDINGLPLKVWAPTFIVIDSMAQIKSGAGLENVERDKAGEIKEMEIAGNIDAMREAKDQMNFIMKIKPLCKQYGIHLNIINHITTEASMSMFSVPKRYLSTLKPGEKLRGSYEAIFQAYGIGRLDMRERINQKNPVYSDSEEGIIAEFQYIKSKNKGEGIPYRMVALKHHGYMPELSDFEYLYSNNFGFSGIGANVSLDILPEVKFSKKSLIEKCHEHPELARAIQFTAKMLIVHTLLEGKFDKPDLTPIINMNYNERIGYIFSYTNRYPGYGHESLTDELATALNNGKKIVNANPKTDLSNSFIDDLAKAFLICESDEITPFIPILDFESLQTPTDDPEQYLQIDEFWIKK